MNTDLLWLIDNQTMVYCQYVQSIETNEHTIATCVITVE